MKVAHTLLTSFYKKIFLIEDPVHPFFDPVLLLIGGKLKENGQKTAEGRRVRTG